MFVFTHSEATVNALARIGLGERLVAWSDPLHMGMVAPHWDLGAFASARAVAHRSFGWDEDKVVEADFALRNEALQEAVSSEDEVLLLFGPNVMDQLNLMQILAWFSTHASDMLQRTRLANSDRNLELLNDEELRDLTEGAEKVFAAAADQYRAAWMAFVSPDPQFLENYLKYGADSPYAGFATAAIGRVLKEYPSSENGLSLTECQILDAIRLGVDAPQALFDAYQETEEHVYLRNWDFWAYLDRMAKAETPLIEVEGGADFLCPPKALAWEPFHAQRLRLTNAGERTLACEEVSEIAAERWIGSVQLVSGNLWYWDYPRSSLTQEARSLASV